MKITIVLLAAMFVVGCLVQKHMWEHEGEWHVEVSTVSNIFQKGLS